MLFEQVFPTTTTANTTAPTITWLLGSTRFTPVSSSSPLLLQPWADGARRRGGSAPHQSLVHEVQSLHGDADGGGFAADILRQAALQEGENTWALGEGRRFAAFWISLFSRLHSSSSSLTRPLPPSPCTSSPLSPSPQPAAQTTRPLTSFMGVVPPTQPCRDAATMRHGGDHVEQRSHVIVVVLVILSLV